jgi:phage terminase small subunit
MSEDQSQIPAIQPPEIEKPGEKPLQKKTQEQFANQYLKDLNGTKAALAAGYSANCAGQIAWEMLNDPKYKHVQDRIAHLMKIRADETKVDAAFVLKKLKMLAEAKIEQYVELVTEKRLVGQGKGKPKAFVEYQVLRWKDFTKLSEDQLGAIQQIKQGQYGIEIKLFDKSWSLDMIAKHIGLYEKDNQQKKVESPVQLYIPDNNRDKKPEEIIPEAK